MKEKEEGATTNRHVQTPPSRQSRATKLNFDANRCVCNDFFSCHDCRDSLEFGKDHDEKIRKNERTRILNILKQQQESFDSDLDDSDNIFGKTYCEGKISGIRIAILEVEAQ